MAKGPKITGKDEAAIIDVYLNLRQALKKFKDEDVKKEAERVLKRPLGLSTVQRTLAAQRKKEKYSTPSNPESLPNDSIDRPWNLASLRKYPLSNTATLFLLGLRKGIIEGVTIREAFWIATLLPVFITTEDIRQNKGFKRMDDLILISYLYSVYDYNCEQAGITTDTSHFDDLDVEKIKSNVQEWYKGHMPLQRDEFNQILDQLNRDDWEANLSRLKEQQK